MNSRKKKGLSRNHMALYGGWIKQCPPQPASIILSPGYYFNVNFGPQV